MSLPPGYFEEMYQRANDPWELDTRWYDRRRFDVTLASLPRQRYRSAFEPACGNGALTERLASRCDSLLAADMVGAAADRARERLACTSGVRVERLTLPGQWPEGRFELVVLSELLYYFAGDELTRVVELAQAALLPGGHLVAVHWRHQVPEYPSTAAEVHGQLRACSGLQRVVCHRERDFMLDVFAAAREGEPVRSVAEETQVPGAAAGSGGAPA